MDAAFDLISNALPFGRLWYDGPEAVSNAMGYAEQYSRAHDAVIRVYDAAGNVIETHEHKGLQGGVVNKSRAAGWPLRDRIDCELMNRRFQFQKRG